MKVIKKSEDTNAAFLAKRGWKILRQPNNICVHVVSQVSKE